MDAENRGWRILRVTLIGYRIDLDGMVLRYRSNFHSLCLFYKRLCEYLYFLLHDRVFGSIYSCVWYQTVRDLTIHILQCDFQI